MEGKRIYRKEKREKFPLMTKGGRSRGVYTSGGYIRELKLIKGGPYKDQRKPGGVIKFLYPRSNTTRRYRAYTRKNIRDSVPVRVMLGISFPLREDYDLGLHMVISHDEKEMTLKKLKKRNRNQT
jgi:hypothetical protein